MAKALVASFPLEQRPTILQPISDQEELSLLNQVASETPNERYREELGRLATDLQSSDGNYPLIDSERARTLWLALTKYGTASERYRKLHAILRVYVSSIDDPDKQIERTMYALWRSIGPAMDPTGGLKEVPDGEQEEN